jgi:antitoxin VapB
MATTRVFKSGNSQAVRIPAELAYASNDMEVNVTRNGDVITIVPFKQDLKAMVARLRAMPKPSSIEKREPIEPRKTGWE